MIEMNQNLACVSISDKVTINRRADVKIGFLCNNQCKFCVQGNKRKIYGNKALKIIKKELEDARSECESIVLTGGEPTIHKEILALVKIAKSLKFKTIQIQTNGRMFAYLEFCKKIIANGANEFSPALHGHINELHDYLSSSKGSFKQTVQGIINLKKLRQQILTNTVITKSNFRYLPQIARLLVSLGVDQFQFAFVHPLGRAGESFYSVIPRMSMVEPYVKEGLKIGIQAKKEVMTEAIPYCFMKGYENYLSESLIPSTKIYDADSIIDDFNKVRKDEGKAKGPRCHKCKYCKVCEGPWREYPDVFGWEEFKPIKNKFKTATKRNKVLKVFENICDLSIHRNNLTPYREKINQIRSTLFSGFDVSWLNDNQKFDFSFSSDVEHNGSLRFSYNNFGEKESFHKKIIDIFLLFKDVFLVKKMKESLEFMRLTNDNHQTTIGLEWQRDSTYPRLKIYFEELFHHYSKEEILSKLKRICQILNIDFNRLGISRNDNIGAICVDFLPHKSLNLKIYLLYNRIDGKELYGLLKLQNIYRKKGILNLFVNKLTDINTSFFYITKRFNTNGRLISLKLYKIYEVKQIINFGKPISEIEAFLRMAKAKNLLEDFSEVKNICGQSRVDLFPVIVAVDRSVKKDKIDLYLSFR